DAEPEPEKKSSSTIIRRRAKTEQPKIEPTPKKIDAPSEITQTTITESVTQTEQIEPVLASTDTAAPSPIIETTTPAPDTTQTIEPLQKIATPQIQTRQILRKSILKIVEPPKPTKIEIIQHAPAEKSPIKAPAKTTPAQSEKVGFRIIKMTKENLDQMVEEEAAKKRRGGLEKDPILKPEDVKFADYRKKEIIFLPKKKKIPQGKELKKTKITTPKAIKRIVEMENTISIQELANQLNVKATDVLKKLMSFGQMATIQHILDLDTATLIASDYKYEVKNIVFNENILLAQSEDKPEELKSRPPVVTVMGHVDHGKTSLLDAIRQTHVTDTEAGGITQHIGAYIVEKEGKQITFIDTPGHEAFTQMRARGALATDIVILVVAADDGVMPQTREALSHAQAAHVPIIVAINKIDKPGANPEKIKQSLSDLGLLPEEWGGQTIFIAVSALKKTNLDKLLEGILLQAEIMDLKANPNRRASGIVLESKLDKGKGPVVTLLVKRGTLKIGDNLISGTSYGKVKAMLNDKGQIIKSVLPGAPVEVLGLDNVPKAGDSFDIPTTEADASKIISHRKNFEKAKTELASQGKITLENLFSKIQAGTAKELTCILKGDTYGSIEAIRDSLEKTSTEKVKVKIIHIATGAINESDVLLASASSALIIGFNIRPDTKARMLAENEHVEIKCYSIIYELLDDIKKSMIGLLEKKKIEKFLGRAEVKQIFVIPKMGTIAGTSVIDGKIIRGAHVRLLRDSKVVYEGQMSSLKRFKDDAKEVITGTECGIGIENYNDIKAGDIIEAFQIELISPELN
ncbi:MAG: translation initiation factor IF-2, partial [Deltaproteobacteria bacterium]|nr:translation initiation factor IF-2 [Deltaproteobacteria bacterium]